MEGKKRTCVICGEKSKKYKKFTCCSKVICLGCLRNSLGKRLKRAAMLKCPNCKNRLEENEILEDLDEEQQKMYNSIMKRKKCRICKVYKEANDDIWKLEACEHKICRNCLKDYLKISVFSKNTKMSNIICPVRQCHHLISLAQFKNMDDFKEINEQISKKEKEDYEEEKNLEKPNLSQKITCFEDLRHDNCEICAYDCEIVDMITLECEHRFCKNCILKYLKMKLNEGLITENHMICPREGCKISINYNILKVNLPKDLFEKYDTLLFKHTVANPQNPNKDKNKFEEITIYCPKCSIEYIIDTNSSFFECVNCKDTYCANKKCMKKWSEHQDLSEHQDFFCKDLRDKRNLEEFIQMEEHNFTFTKLKGVETASFEPQKGCEIF